MEREVRMPKLGLTMEEAELAAWNVSVGDEVEAGQELATINTDKVETALESPCTGQVVEVLVQPGSVRDVGEVLCRIQEG